MAGPDDARDDARAPRTAGDAAVPGGRRALDGDVAADWATMIADGGAEPAPTLDDDARPMSQAEIDGALGLSADGAGPDGVRAIAHPGVAQYERLPLLEVAADRAVRHLNASLRALFGVTVEVARAPTVAVRYGEYLDGVPLPALLGLFRAEGWGGGGLLGIEQALAYACLDRLLGGGRGAGPGGGPNGGPLRLDGRPYTGLETGLLRRLVEAVLSDLETAFRPLAPTRLAMERIETNPRLAALARPGDAAVLLRFRLDLDGRGGDLHLLLPQASLEPIRSRLQRSATEDGLARDAAWEGHLATEIWQADVALEAVLHETTLPLGRVLNLAVGDTLMFERRPSDPIVLRCGDWVLTQGRIGRVDDHIAVQVSRPLRRARTTLAAFAAAADPRSDG